MGYITFFSETGTPHAGVFLQYHRSSDTEWLGFWPGNSMFGAYGRVLTTNESASVEFYIRFAFEDSLIVRARNKVITDYYSGFYFLGVCDCVTFARDMAEACGLETAGWTYVPSSLVYDLRRFNGYYTDFNGTPRPWD
jgi:hypothetical protein